MELYPEKLRRNGYAAGAAAVLDRLYSAGYEHILHAGCGLQVAMHVMLHQIVDPACPKYQGLPSFGAPWPMAPLLMSPQVLQPAQRLFPCYVRRSYVPQMPQVDASGGMTMCVGRFGLAAGQGAMRGRTRRSPDSRRVLWLICVRSLWSNAHGARCTLSNFQCWTMLCTPAGNLRMSSSPTRCGLSHVLT